MREHWVNVVSWHAKSDPDKPLPRGRVTRDAVIQTTFREELGTAKFRVVADEALSDFYSDPKETGHPPFRLENGRSKVMVGAGKTTVQQSCSLPAIGGNTYRVEASYRDKSGETIKKSKNAVAARRRVHFVALETEKHDSVSAKLEEAIDGLPARFWDRDKLYVELRRAQPSATDVIPRGNVAYEEKAHAETFTALLKKHVAPLRTCVPGFALVLVDQIASKVPHSEWEEMDLNEHRPRGFHGYDPRSRTLHVTLLHPVWAGFSELEDEEKHWLEEISLVLPGVQGAPPAPTAVPRDAVTLVGPKEDEGFVRLEIDLEKMPGIEEAILLGGGKFTLRHTLRYAADDGWLWGASFNDVNVVAIATRSRWKPLELEDIKATVIHEVAHRLGLVPDGDHPLHMVSTDSSDGKGHCVDPACVMVAKGRSPDTFCAECVKALRKCDLSFSSKVFGDNIA